MNLIQNRIEFGFDLFANAQQRVPFDAEMRKGQ